LSYDSAEKFSAPDTFLHGFYYDRRLVHLEGTQRLHIQPQGPFSLAWKQRFISEVKLHLCRFNPSHHRVIIQWLASL